MNDSTVEPARRDAMARAAAPYRHAQLQAVAHKHMNADGTPIAPSLSITNNAATNATSTDIGGAEGRRLRLVTPKGSSFLDTLLMGVLTVLIVGIAFMGFVLAVEGWQRWSEHRRLKEHFRN
jgi:hypothetical protein